MEGKRRRRRTEAGLITFPADFTGGREVKITAPPALCSRPPLLPLLLPAFWRRARGACFSLSLYFCLSLCLCLFPLGYWKSDGWLHKETRSISHSQYLSLPKRLFLSVSPSCFSFSLMSVITALTSPLFLFCYFHLLLSFSLPFFLSFFLVDEGMFLSVSFPLSPSAWGWGQMWRPSFPSIPRGEQGQVLTPFWRREEGQGEGRAVCCPKGHVLGVKWCISYALCGLIRGKGICWICL